MSMGSPRRHLPQARSGCPPPRRPRPAMNALTPVVHKLVPMHVFMHADSTPRALLAKLALRCCSHVGLLPVMSRSVPVHVVPLLATRPASFNDTSIARDAHPHERSALRAPYDSEEFSQRFTCEREARRRSNGGERCGQ